MQESKICSHCKEIKNSLEFYIRKDNGRCSSWCKSCQKKRNQSKDYKDSMKEYMRLYHKEYKNTDQYKEYQTKYRKSGKSKEWFINYRKSDYGKQYHSNYIKDWYKTPQGKALAARCNHKRRMMTKNSVCDLTAEQWEEIKAGQNYRCVMCGEEKKLTRDHIIPLSKGGELTKSNVQGLCQSCNSKKHTRILRLKQGVTNWAITLRRRMDTKIENMEGI
jgi:5-methylcytosine-specific restriction endonuclease McrA